MLSELTSILQNESATGEITLSVGTALLCIAAALLFGLMLACTYIFSGEHTKSFAVSLVLLPAVVQAVIMLTSGNIGMSVAVLGAFSLVRFRSVPGSAREICCIFFSMAIGLACGAGYIGYASIITVVLSAALFLLNKIPFGDKSKLDRSLKVLVPENVEYTEVFAEPLAKYTAKYELEKVKTANMGSMYELRYNIRMKEAGSEKAFIDELRCRNGNLPIVIGSNKTSNEEM